MHTRNLDQTNRKTFAKRLRRHAVRGACTLLGLVLALLPFAASAATIGADGGITLWLSWDDATSPGTSIDSVINETDAVMGGSTCDPTNAARNTAGAPNSPPSCAGTPCTGREKLIVDLQRGARGICEATEGAHYIRRVFVSDEGRGWNSADVRWSVGTGGSSAGLRGWRYTDRATNMRSAERTCIGDVFAHELGHYIYALPDRYADSSGYYRGTVDGGASTFRVNVTEGDPNTMMNGNFPHRFVDTTNARIVVSYTPPGGDPVVGEELTPALLADADAANDGPDRRHHTLEMPFATDEWSLLPLEHIDLQGVHTEGEFPVPADCPETEIVFVGDDVVDPGTILVLDRSGSMGVETNEIEAVQYVQEAGLFLYHSSNDDELVGTFVYNGFVDELFSYGPYDAANDLDQVDFFAAEGLTNIAGALDEAIDTLEQAHAETGPNGARIILLSDGVQTTGQDLWDQVDRAGGLGIRIDTLSFGAADAATMEAIAGNTDGEATPVSERENANDLKMVMTRRFAELRGRTPIFTHLGMIPADEIQSEDGIQQWTRAFRVPPFSGDLQVYDFFPREMPKGEFALRLVSPSGALFTSDAPDNVEEMGRFLGLQVQKPEAGEWLLQVRGESSQLAEKGSEIVIFANNRDLKASARLDQLVASDSVRILGRADFPYPMTELKVKAHLYSAGDYIQSIELVDDGTPNLDDTAHDGVYAARLALDGSDPAIETARANGASKLRVELEFRVKEESMPAPRANYETGTKVEDLKAEFRAQNLAGLHAWATTVVGLDEKYDEESNVTLSAQGKNLELDAGETGELVIQIAGARPMARDLRIVPGPGLVLEDLAELTCEDDDALTFCARLALRAIEEAPSGLRKLQVQFGGTILELPDAIQVQGFEAGCPAVAQTVCNQASRGSLLVAQHKAGKEMLKVNLAGLSDEFPVASMGAPDSSPAAFDLCLYADDGSLLQSWEIDRGGEMCGRRPCWTPKSDKGYQFSDKAGLSDGINKILLFGGQAGKGKLSLIGKNNARKGIDRLPAVTKALAEQQSPTVHLVSDTGMCVGAAMTTGSERKPGLYVARR